MQGTALSSKYTRNDQKKWFVVIFLSKKAWVLCGRKADKSHPNKWRMPHWYLTAHLSIGYASALLLAAFGVDSVYHVIRAAALLCWWLCASRMEDRTAVTTPLHPAEALLPRVLVDVSTRCTRTFPGSDNVSLHWIPGFSYPLTWLMFECCHTCSISMVSLDRESERNA